MRIERENKIHFDKLKKHSIAKTTPVVNNFLENNNNNNNYNNNNYYYYKTHTNETNKLTFIPPPFPSH